MISVGIDVSKGRSTICVIRPHGEVVSAPFEIEHTEQDLQQLVEQIRSFSDDELRVVLEATGIYHLPVVSFLQQHGIFVSVIHPLSMKKYASIAQRQGKTVKIDSDVVQY